MNIRNGRSLHPPCQDCIYKATEGRSIGNLARDGEEVPEVPESGGHDPVSSVLHISQVSHPWRSSVRIQLPLPRKLKTVVLTFGFAMVFLFAQMGKLTTGFLFRRSD